MSDQILKIGAEGLESTDDKVESLVNRMVNAETPGFKSSDITVRSFPLELQIAEEKLSTKVPKVDGTFYNFAQGPLVRTGKITDLAIGNNGFFVLLCPWGEGFSRDGRFSIDKDGKVVTTAGNYQLLGNNGPIVVSSGSNIEVTDTGEIRENSQLIDKIRVVDFENKQALESVNGVIFKDSSGNMIKKEIDNPKIVQGYIEASNANVIDQMIDMIYLSRIYGTLTKLISTRDGTMSQAISIGKSQ